MSTFIKMSLVVCGLLLLSSCASNNKVVPRHANYQSVSFGVVLATEEVTLGGSNSGIGSYAGSLAAISDSTSNSFLGLLARGIAGGIIGSVAEERVTRSNGTQYTIEKNNGAVISIASKTQNLNIGDCIKITRSRRTTHLGIAAIGLCGPAATTPKTKL